MWGKGLLTGMKITIKHCFGEKITVQYPEEKLPMTEKFRGGRLKLASETCIACKLCSMACPNQALTLTVAADEQKKRHMKSYIHHSGRCLYCNLCLEACPVHALSWDKNYEIATYSKADMDYECMPNHQDPEVKQDE